jgi:DNA repair exonuclease SbcCD ATPase subunit
MRKCATLEAGGTSAHDALLASAGFGAGEIEALRAQAKQLEEELGQAQEREAQLQRALDQSVATIALRDKELKAARQILDKTMETQKGGRQSIEALNKQVTSCGRPSQLTRKTSHARFRLTGWVSTHYRRSASSETSWPMEKVSGRRH